MTKSEACTELLKLSNEIKARLAITDNRQGTNLHRKTGPEYKTLRALYERQLEAIKIAIQSLG